MNKILLIESNPQLADFFTINLLAWVGAETICMSEAKFAVDFLQDNPDEMNLIITRGTIGTERTAEAIHQLKVDKSLQTPLFVIGDSPLSSQGIEHIESAFDIKHLIQTAAKALGVTAQDMAQLNVPEFFEIPIQHFKIIDSPICDVYKSTGSDSFEHYLSAFDPIVLPVLAAYAKEGHPYLYVKKNDRLKFVTNINEEIASKINLKELNEDEQMSAVEMSQSLLQQKIARLGITEETIELSQRNIKFMAHTAKRSTNIKHLLKRLMKNKTGYQFRHSQILMFVATHLMQQLDWVTEEQQKKLQFIAFWHDIALENSEQAQIHTDADLKKAKLTPPEKELIKKHAQISATIISKYPNAPIGVEQIIKQHHGVINGLGFSEHYSQNISPMAIVFILSEDLVDSMIHATKDYSFKAKIAQMKARYSTQRFKKILEALETIVT